MTIYTYNCASVGPAGAYGARAMRLGEYAELCDALRAAESVARAFEYVEIIANGVTVATYFRGAKEGE